MHIEYLLEFEARNINFITLFGLITYFYLILAINKFIIEVVCGVRWWFYLVSCLYVPDASNNNLDLTTLDILYIYKKILLCGYPNDNNVQTYR